MLVANTTRVRYSMILCGNGSISYIRIRDKYAVAKRAPEKLIDHFSRPACTRFPIPFGFACDSRGNQLRVRDQARGRVRERDGYRCSDEGICCKCSMICWDIYYSNEHMRYGIQVVFYSSRESTICSFSFTMKRNLKFSTRGEQKKSLLTLHS